ncbi:hypothetical protein [Enterococcus lemanii]|uniref:Uncharacterized protein n=1 Tax=Enterococcus lemanii TaxID=1159752 RepID=A0ABV9MWI0_9ENTE|nr:hypothetical protein [Enterococcus lemanii]MBM7708640.1 hypothetical protein [Enterococcus lemanii]
MRIRRELIGIVLAFSTAGIFATKANENAYQEIYTQQTKQVVRINETLKSEFISSEDSKLLTRELNNFELVEKKQNRKALNKLIETEKQHLSEVEERNLLAEAKTAQKEYSLLLKEFTTLEKKSEEAYVLLEDKQNIPDVKQEVNNLKSTDKVKPIRNLEKKIHNLFQGISIKQQQMISAIDELKDLNIESSALLSRKYVSKEDKNLLETDQNESSQFFENANDIEIVIKRRETSQKLINQISEKQEKIERDFTDNEDQSLALIDSVNTLLSTGELSTIEKETLKTTSLLLTNSLNLTEYQPGNLAINYQELKKNYDEYSNNSTKRLEEKAQQQAAAERQAALEAEKASGPGELRLVGDWYQAPAGYKFLKESSRLTYGQVKKPNNFRLITIEEAANYSPGHGNGSAKQ